MKHPNKVATFQTAKLVELLGPTVEVRRSTREGARYPYYLATKTGPLHFNTQGAQAFLKTNCDWCQPEAPAQDSPKETAQETAQEIPKEAAQAPAQAHPEKPGKPRRRFFAPDEDLGL